MTRSSLFATLLALACATTPAEPRAPRPPSAAALACPAPALLETVGPDSRGTVELCKLAGVPHGPERDWDVNGVQRAQSVWDHGRKTGVWIVFDANGARSEERSFVDGEESGPEKLYFASGGVRRLTCWSAGKRQGPVAQWAPTGELVLLGQNEQGKESGTWFMRDLENGASIRWKIENGVDGPPENAPFPDAALDALVRSCG